MTDDIVERVLASRRYRDVDRALVGRLAAEEAPKARSGDEAVKRVKRRLHQAVGAYRGGGLGKATAAVGSAWKGRWDEPMRAACRRVLELHASTRERIVELDRFYAAIWSALGGAPGSLLDLACGLNPFALPFMALPPDARYLACDSDRRVLDEVKSFLSLVGQPHRTFVCDLAAAAPEGEADVALLLKTVPLLDRQDPSSAVRLLTGLRVGHVVLSFPRRSLGGRGGLEGSYRSRIAGLRRELGERIGSVEELEFSSELVYVLEMGNGA